MSGIYLPTQGLYCVAIQAPVGFRHFFYESLEDALTKARAEDARGQTVYIAQGTFREAVNRKSTNVLFLRSFFLDIDVGEKWALKSQVEAAQTLKQFVADTGLPMPAVTSSGNGLYAHWPLTENVDPSRWKIAARYLKSVVQSYAPALGDDSSRTADPTSVLRPPGTHNRKSSAERPVRVLKDCEPISFEDFVAILGAAGKRRNIKVAKPPVPRPSSGVNAEFTLPDELIDPRIIAEKCAQIRHVRDTKGDVSEPLWYAMIGVIRFATEGERFIHEWSQGHADYTATETDRKIQHHIESNVGPTTCVRFHEHRPEGCAGCPYVNKIKSPIVLGRPAPITRETPKDADGLDVPNPPEGFVRAEQGIMFVEGDVRRVVYPYDFYPVSSARDQGLGYETVTWRHYLPHEGWSEFTMRSALVADAKAFTMELIDNHVHVHGAVERKLMNAYASGYLAKLRAHRKMMTLYSQMGWKEREGRPLFVLGERIISAEQDGSVAVTVAGLANNVPEAAKHIRKQGDIAPWVECTAVFDEPGMAPLAFAFLAAAFGAPLMRFTGFEGAIVSMVGPSGAGKTLTSRWALSAYGLHSELIMLSEDTFNGLISRLGLYGNLPLVVDEVSNIDQLQLSNMVYRITQGRDKVRLNRNAKERGNINHWNTLGLVTTNSSLYEKLSHLKGDASAELNRVFEYRVTHVPALSHDVSANIYRTITDNYGGVGEEYVKHLVANEGKHAERIRSLSRKIIEDTQAPGEERFWIALVAATIYGGIMASELGLVNFRVAPVYKWALDRIRANRLVRIDATVGADIALARFIDEHTSGRLIVSTEGTGKNSFTSVVQAPRGPLVMAQDIGPGGGDRYLYISRPAVRNWIGKLGLDPVHVEDWLTRNGMLLDTQAVRVLGANTEYAGRSQRCWVVPIENSEVREKLKVVQLEEARRDKK